MYPDAPFLQFIMRQTWSVQSAHFSCPVEGAIKEFWGFKVMFVKIMCRNDELRWLITKRFRAFCLRACCAKFATGLNIIISPVANFAQQALVEISSAVKAYHFNIYILCIFSLSTLSGTTQLLFMYSHFCLII